jgi:omega-hydroxy-beta-dihydromenaquinone-9 sulfotransferase
MKIAYLIYGLRLKILFRLTRKYGFPFHPLYFLRFLYVIQNAIWSSVFSIAEKHSKKKLIDASSLPNGPLIIIGHWRSGSTYLHQLLTYDHNGTVPTNFQTTLPDSFLVSEKYYKPVMKFLMGKKYTRPFDNIILDVDGPQEEEFAILKMCGLSPLTKLIYPDSSRFFLEDFSDYELNGDVYEEWKNAMTEFCKKLTLTKPKRIVLKNPFHSMRIQTLLRLFPNAKFIHIHRNPLDVIPSTVNMWNIVGRQNIMRGKFAKATTENIVEILDRLLTYIHKCSLDLPAESYCEIRYENLESDPVTEIKKAYRKLELPFTPEFEEAIKKNLVNDFKKNIYSLSEENRKFISGKLKHHMERLGYH